MRPQLPKLISRTGQQGQFAARGNKVVMLHSDNDHCCWNRVIQALNQGLFRSLSSIGPEIIEGTAGIFVGQELAMSVPKPSR